MSNNLLTKKFDDFKDYFNQKINSDNITIEELNKLRNQAESLLSEFSNLELTVKKDSNSLYGSSGNEYFFFRDYDIATDITISAKYATVIVDRAINKFFTTWADKPEIVTKIKEFYPNANLINNTNYKEYSDSDLCIYGDTDSRYIDLGYIYNKLMMLDLPENDIELADFAVFLMENFIDKVIGDVIKKDSEYRNSYYGFLHMDHEITTRKSVFIGKKQYIMVPIWKDGKNVKRHLKFTGVDLKKGSMSPRLKAILSHVISKYFLENYSYEELQKETIGAFKYIISKQQRSLIYKISSVNDIKLIKWDEKEQTYKSPKNHIQHKLVIFWHNFIRKGNNSDIYKPVFENQKMNWYYDINHNVVAVPDDVDIDKVKGLPKPDYIYMLKTIFVKNILRYVTELKSKDIKMEDIEAFLSFVKKIKL